MAGCVTPGPFIVPYGWQQCWGIKHPNGTAGDAYPTNTNNIEGGTPAGYKMPGNVDQLYPYRIMQMSESGKGLTEYLSKYKYGNTPSNNKRYKYEENRYFTFNETGNTETWYEIPNFEYELYIILYFNRQYIK